MTNEQLAQRIDDLDEKISMIMRHLGLDPVLVDTEENDRADQHYKEYLSRQGIYMRNS